MAHFAGLVAAGLHPNPVPHCDFVTSTTHKTLVGPALGLRPLQGGARAGARPAVFPGMQGGPMRARDRREGDLLPDRRDAGVPRVPGAGPRERRRARGRAAGGRARRAHRRHRHAPAPGRPARTRSGRARTPRSGSPRCCITVNRNTVPFDERPPTVASGVRIGTPACTMRGFDEDDFREVGRIIAGALGDGPDIAALAARCRGALREAAALPGLPRLDDLRGMT